MFYSKVVDIVRKRHAFCLVDIVGNVGTAYSGSFCQVSYLEVWSEIQLLCDELIVNTFSYLAFLNCQCVFCGLSDIIIAVFDKLFEREITCKPDVAQGKEHDGKWGENGSQHPVALCKVFPAQRICYG